MLIFFKSNQSTENSQKPKRSSELVQDHLANERTYMSWMRTAIALMGFGVFILRFRADQTLDWPLDYELQLGFIHAIAGFLTVFLSTWHYFAVRERIRQNIDRLPGRSVIFLSTIVTILGIGIIYLIGISSDLPEN